MRIAFLIALIVAIVGCVSGKRRWPLSLFGPMGNPRCISCSEVKNAHLCGSCCKENVCLPNPCKNDGICSSDGNGYSCNCTTGYLGENCDVPICDPDRCKNNGMCSSVDSDCYCLTRYNGENCDGGFQRTVIFLEKQTSLGEDVFIRGGIDHKFRSGCIQDANTSPCAISINHPDLGSSTFFSKYNAWKVGDNFLDFYGGEAGQASFGNQPAEGSPAVWTSSVAGDAGYNPLNKWGMHYWMLDIMMDCDQTENGWFEMKGFLSSNWENDIGHQKCTGDGAAGPELISNNHYARCGYLNVFHWNQHECLIEKIP
ncbi:hypothetical protein SNE40_016515 [Patella caerulea]|uniref:EGF-like domain-containing protein n=2 Tax=Patella caerulea TaxID=87958 RepID=A0AAN8JEB9_PATCE